MRNRLTRPPRPTLRPFIQSVWAIDEAGVIRPDRPVREHVVPTGAMHLVFRLSNDALRLYDNDEDGEGRVVSTAVVGGARARFYIRDISTPLCSVGAQLRPGAARLLLPRRAIAESLRAYADFLGLDVGPFRRSGRSVSFEVDLSVSFWGAHQV
jgi:hypothetical protein